MIGFRSLVLLLAAAASCSCSGGGLDRGSKRAGLALPGAYIFEFEADADIKSFHKRTVGKANTRHEFDHELFKGISVQFHDVESAEDMAEELASLPAVKQKWPVMMYSPPDMKVDSAGVPGMQHELLKRGLQSEGDVEDLSSPNKDTYSPHVMAQVDRLRAEGVTGKGLKIAVVDTGIDYKHPALGGCFGESCLVSFGTDLVGDAYTGPNKPRPDSDPMDCMGHGTHIAGIIAAQKNPMGFTGVAPGVKLGAYRVFGCGGEVSNDVLISAFNQAYEAGADIVTASIANTQGWAEDPLAVAISRIVGKGVPCFLAAGNYGSMGLFYPSSPGTGKGVTSVASFENTFVPAIVNVSHYSVDSSSQKHDFGALYGTPGNWDNVQLPLYALSLDVNSTYDGCSSLPRSTPNLSKHVLLLRRGSCDFEIQADNAYEAGARYILVYGEGAAGGPAGPDASLIRGIKATGAVTTQQAKEWISLLKAGHKIKVNMSNGKDGKMTALETKNHVTGGAVSVTSSWGPTWEMGVEPQFGAPGGHILSTFPRANGSFAVLSGTSMSCPFAAGVAALIAQVRQSHDPAMIEDLMTVNSNPQVFSDGTSLSSFLAPVPQQGGGLIRAYDAAHASILLSPASLSFNDTEHFVKERNFTLRNEGTKEVTLHISHVPAATMYLLEEGTIYPQEFPNDVADPKATLEFSESKVTVAAGQTVTIDVMPTPPRGLDDKRLPVWSGYVAINGTDGTSISLPYQGLTGSLRKATVLAAADTWIATSPGSTQNAVPDKTTFTLPKAGTATGDDTLPLLAWSLALGCAKLVAHIIPTGNGNGTSIGQPVGFPVRWSGMGTNSVPWAGEMAGGSYAPAGTYKIRYQALRVLGNEKNKGDWDTSETVSFTIKYK